MTIIAVEDHARTFIHFCHLGSSTLHRLAGSSLRGTKLVLGSKSGRIFPRRVRGWFFDFCYALRYRWLGRRHRPKQNPTRTQRSSLICGRFAPGPRRIESRNGCFFDWTWSLHPPRIESLSRWKFGARFTELQPNFNRIWMMHRNFLIQ